MTCPHCQQDNPAGARFCNACGTPVGAPCPTCGAENPPAAKFCNACGTAVQGLRVRPQVPAADNSVAEVSGVGHRVSGADTRYSPRAYTPRHLAEQILQSRAALEGERKQVTVLFADVQGSMELSEQVDPEAWHTILDRFFQILTDGVHRFEGTVNQYTGDGIMALFGAPIAHEDHAQRACYTALHLRDALRAYGDELRIAQGLNFGFRLGLHSGEVVVGKIGDDLRMDYTAQGHTVGVAQRMEQITAANAITLSAATARLVEGYFTLRSLGETRVKGVRDPITVFQLEGLGAVRTRLDVSRARGFSTFVGRRDELATLEASFERAVAGEGQVVGVVADAGVGKSRLCLEAVQRWRAQGVSVREAHCLAHGRSVPLLPVLELLRGFFDIAESDNARVARNKVAGALLLLDRELEPSLPLVFELLGIGDPGHAVVAMAEELRERRLFDIVRRVLHARSAREPAVIVMEDLHWIDEPSAAFLQHLVEVVPSTRTLLLLNFRPEYRGDWMQRSYYRQLPLRPLGPQEIADLLRHLLGADPALDGLAAQIQARTAGNPFFIEEVVQSLVETGQLQGQRGAYQLRGPIEALKIPPTVQPLLAARIDRLSEHAKHVLQAAAVLGQQIAESVLVEIVDLTADDVAAALRQLVAAEFLHPVALYPEPEFAFKHPLTEEVAYSAQLGDRRARLHGRAAEALERRLRDTHGELAAVLAQHWERAGEALRAARWYRRAAERTTMTHSRASFQHWSKVRALADRLPESPEQQELATLARVQMFGVGARISAPEEEMAELFRECDAIVRRSGSNDARAQLMTGYGFYRLYTTGNVLAASDDAATAIELADRSGNVALRLGAYFMACAVHIPRDLQRALDTIQLAFDVIATDPAAGRMVLSTGFRADVAFLFIRAVVLSLMARLDDAEDVVGRLRSLAQETDEAVGLAHGAAARLALERGDDAAAEREVTRVLEAAEASGNLSGALNGYSNRGELLLRQGRYPEALAALETAMTIHRRQRVFRQLEPSTLALAVAARLYMGDVGAAQAIAHEALTMAVDRGLLLGEFAVRLRLAEISLVRNGADGRETVEQELARATELVEQTHLYAQRPTIHVLRARLAAAAGDGAERDRQVHEAVRLCDAMGAPLRARRVVRDLAH